MPTLSWINQRHITEEHLDRTDTLVINAYNCFLRPKCWGSGKRVSADGTIFTDTIDWDLIATHLPALPMLPRWETSPGRRWELPASARRTGRGASTGTAAQLQVIASCWETRPAEHVVQWTPWQPYPRRLMRDVGTLHNEGTGRGTRHASGIPRGRGGAGAGGGRALISPDAVGHA
jgi:hypothetical protein